MENLSNISLNSLPFWARKVRGVVLIDVADYATCRREGVTEDGHGGLEISPGGRLDVETPECIYVIHNVSAGVEVSTRPYPPRPAWMLAAPTLPQEPTARPLIAADHLRAIPPWLRESFEKRQSSFWSAWVGLGQVARLWEPTPVWGVETPKKALIAELAKLDGEAIAALGFEAFDRLTSLRERLEEYELPTQLRSYFERLRHLWEIVVARDDLESIGWVLRNCSHAQVLAPALAEFDKEVLIPPLRYPTYANSPLKDLLRAVKYVEPRMWWGRLAP